MKLMALLFGEHDEAMDSHIVTSDCSKTTDSIFQTDMKVGVKRFTSRQK